MFVEQVRKKRKKEREKKRKKKERKRNKRKRKEESDCDVTFLIYFFLKSLFHDDVTVCLCRG